VLTPINDKANSSNRGEIFTLLEERTNKLLSHSFVTRFIQDNPHVTREMIERSQLKVYEAIKEALACKKCSDLNDCPNLLKGHCAVLQANNVMVDVFYSPCEKHLAKVEQQKREKLIQTFHIPIEIREASFDKFKGNDENLAAFKAALLFAQTVEPRKKGEKGLYLHGGFGVGKSFLMGSIMRAISERGIGIIMVYLPDYLRDLKASIQTKEVGDKVRALQEVPILILDDIGAEHLTAWTRDEILGAILDYRVNNHLPTCYTSNYSLDELMDHLSDVGRGLEPLKARRIMERIKHFTDIYCINDINHR